DNEPGIAGWVIKLTDASGKVITDTTDENGEYCFNNLAPGEYVVSEELQAGWTQTAPAAPGTYTITIVIGQNINGLDFGNRKETGSICGTKYFDRNKNGQRDENEIGVPEWEIVLTSTDGKTQSTTTDNDGVYCFYNLVKGTYTISEILRPDWTQTSPVTAPVYSISLTEGQEITNLDFGNWYNADTCYTPPKGLVGWWPLDAIEVGDITKDISIYKNDGTLKNGPALSGGKVDMSLNFDGVDDYVEVPDSWVFDFNTSGFSIDAWILTSEQSNKQKIVEKLTNWPAGPGYSLYIEEGKLCYLLATGSYTVMECALPETTSIINNKWHHVALTVDRLNDNYVSLFLDGKRIHAKYFPDMNGSFKNQHMLRIGSSSYAVTDLFKGWIDEVEIFDSVLTSNQIFKLWMADSVGKCKETSTGVESEGKTPNDYMLWQSYPNPFNPTTVIQYQLPKSSSVTLKLYDILGREVSTLVNETQDAGMYKYKLNASNLSSGVYLYQLKAGTFTMTKKITLIK
ncbi:MAG: T9SS C-terminal target domain-containing protein, partial [Ignavibacteriales bacterium]